VVGRGVKGGSARQTVRPKKGGWCSARDEHFLGAYGMTREAGASQEAKEWKAR